MRCGKQYQPHTMREFLEYDYPELLEAAENGCAILAGLQNVLVELLPLSKKMLPSSIERLNDVQAQTALTVYIYHYSLFAFADKVYSLIKEQCAALAEALNSNGKQDEDEAADKLMNTLQSLGRMPLDNLLAQSVAGLMRLNIFKDYISEMYDFLVIPVFNEDGTLRANWSFRDIIGTIVRDGLLYEQLLADCVNAPLPDSITIGKVVDDETLLRIY